MFLHEEMFGSEEVAVCTLTLSLTLLAMATALCEILTVCLGQGDSEWGK